MDYRTGRRSPSDGGDLTLCDGEVWQYFDPGKPLGYQIYRSYSDEELLDILIKTMNHQGRTPDYSQVYYIYKQYIRRRFQNLNAAKDQARTRIKRLREEMRWPADWPERVSPEPLLQKLRQRRKKPSQEDIQLIHCLCTEARETGLPPAISITVRSRLDKLYGCKAALELMGIPALNKGGLRHMTRYWQVQKKAWEEAEKPVSEEEEEVYHEKT